jgi:hypothetical protein
MFTKFGNLYNDLISKITMKNVFIVLLVLAFTLSSSYAQAQRRSSRTNNTGIGFQMDFGDGRTYAGFGIKHFFSPRTAGGAHLLFATGSTMLGFEIQPHFAIRNAPGLKWYVGAGLGFLFYNNKYYRNPETSVMLRPMIGLDYQLQSAPLSFGFDWRPMIIINQGGGNNVGRFGFAFRYTF